MAKIIGRQIDLGVAVESTRGTAVAPQFWMPRVDFSFDDTVELFNVNSSLGRLADANQAHVLTKWGEGDIGAEVRDVSIGPVLYAALGTLSTSGPSDSAYTHAFSLQDSTQHKSLTLTVDEDNATNQYALCMLNTLEFNMELDGILNFTANFMGKTSTGASATASYSAENKFVKKHLGFKLAANIAGLSGASAISLKSLTLTLTKNVEADNTLGTVEPEDFLNKQFSVEGSVTLNYEDETYKEYMRGETYRAMEIAWTNTDETIGAGSTNPSLTIQLPRVRFFDWERDMSLDDVVPQTIGFKGYYDITNSLEPISTCELVNGQTSY